MEQLGSVSRERRKSFSTGRAPTGRPSVISDKGQPLRWLAKESRLPPLIGQSSAQFYHRPYEAAYESLAKQRGLRKLLQLFEKVDQDNSGNLSLKEFHQALRNQAMQKAFAVLGVQPHQTEVLFNSLDVDRSGQVCIKEFMGGLRELIGENLDSIGRELELIELSPAYKARQRSETFQIDRAEDRLMRVSSAPTMTLANSTKNMSTFRVEKSQFDPRKERAFLHSAQAKALHAATAKRSWQ